SLTQMRQIASHKFPKQARQVLNQAATSQIEHPTIEHTALETIPSPTIPAWANTDYEPPVLQHGPDGGASSTSLLPPGGQGLDLVGIDYNHDHAVSDLLPNAEEFDFMEYESESEVGSGDDDVDDDEDNGNDDAVEKVADREEIDHKNRNEGEYHPM
ncbi:hypothetical protein BGZ83_001556, partial [Gryganskiella cystojenkinii]